MNKDFREIWDDQYSFNDKLVDLDSVKEDKEKFQKWSNFYHLALMREVGEVLDTVDWKIHRKEKKDFIRSNTLEELTDVLKYWMSLCQLHGFDYDDIFESYFNKTAVVEQRHKQEMQDSITETDKVVGVDIDGVLADYPRSFVEFINEELGTKHDASSLQTYHIYEELGIDKELGIYLKDKYRQSGYKRNIPVIDGAKELLQGLRDKGYKIVILTARPYKKYNRIFADTMDWLNNNGLVYDEIIFDEEKEERLLKEFGKNQVEFFIEDVANNANGIAELGANCFLVDRPYNQDSTIAEDVTRVKRAVDVLDYIREVE